MKLGLFIFAFALLALPLLGAEPRTTTYYVQLIRGSDSDTPPSPDSKQIGPKLAGTFGSVFKWKNYWEIAARQVEVPAGQKARVNLNNERAVELDLSQPGKRKVSALRNGEVVASTISPTSEAMTITGGDRGEQHGCWFIVVRRDKPLTR